MTVSDKNLRYDGGGCDDATPVKIQHQVFVNAHI